MVRILFNYQPFQTRSTIFLSSLGPILADQIPISQPIDKTVRNSQSVYLFSCTFHEAMKAINSLKQKKSDGVDKISNYSPEFRSIL